MSLIILVVFESRTTVYLPREKYLHESDISLETVRVAFVDAGIFQSRVEDAQMSVCRDLDVG